MGTFPAFIPQIIPGIPLRFLRQLVERGLLHIAPTNRGLFVSADIDQSEAGIQVT